ncbi:oxidoreductase, 2OG-Fe(II) oxygenase family [Aspergillus clavatus NRRL 1]|uniref:Prolyl 4-hydroxylase alpha subunit domain-containing protein n=1 Tax=Aspergillus clavatus (strain ATCC 1007 / CBS 513.65 / DSM 816 / NCTC 3887 / NRRL 1 / QM 1276 / 107) TaxID=344612 RepID=A1CKU6_ASPCL|nr:uncharacterized protein ACLA_039860 [Aspergillus clavatus NRRL 1]EAW09770.1 conserved hypothetical protein [Aspergillus clavatus NRRL 1]
MPLKLSTLLTSLFYLLPLYLFVLAPFLRQVFPPTDPSSSPHDADQDLDQDTTQDPALNLLDDTFISIDDGITPTCPAPSYRTHVLSHSPLVIYIENFLTADEATHLVNTSLPNYTPSIIYTGSTPRIDPSTRLSDRALLPRDTPVRCLEARARAFQGWRPHLYIERMWAQRYNASGHYRHHYDWAGSMQHGGDRASTFMVYLAAECEGGGTNFPRLRMPRAREWCRFLECENEDEGEDGNEGDGGKGKRKGREGVTFKPIQGNAIFWENLRPDGSGYPETWHAALPVTAGTKVGLNIWSWYQPPRRR